MPNSWGEPTRMLEIPCLVEDLVVLDTIHYNNGTRIAMKYHYDYWICTNQVKQKDKRMRSILTILIFIQNFWTNPIQILGWRLLTLTPCLLGYLLFQMLSSLSTLSTSALVEVGDKEQSVLAILSAFPVKNQQEQC